MPQVTKVSKAFGDAIGELLDGLSPNQASYRTSISDEYIRKMRNGRVASEEKIRQLVIGLRSDPREQDRWIARLRILAGYDLPSDVGDAVCGVVKAVKPDLSEDALHRIAQVVREIAAEYETQGSEGPSTKDKP